jgi:HAD superfamily hydrolase (TIGR01509 family)
MKGFFFDVDDTLCNSGAIHAEAFAHTLQYLQFESTNFDYEKFKGIPTEDVFQKLGIRDEYLVEATHIKRTYFQENCEKIRLLPGVKEFLTYLRDNQNFIAAVSSGNSHSVTRSLSATGILEIFDLVITSQDTKQHKPFPDPYLTALTISNLSPDKCYVLEDSYSGFMAGMSAGIYTCLINPRIPVWFEKNEMSAHFFSMSELSKSVREA